MLCQKLPPTTVKRPGLRDADAEQAELGVGAADDDRASPRGGRSAAAAAPVTVADDGARLDDVGEDGAVEPADLEHALRPVALARARTCPELEPSDGSVTNSPESFVRIQSPSMPTCAIDAKTSGSCRAIQRKRAGAVIATQSPARS